MKEIAYYLFFGLMVFAKGIGLDSGRKSYYILSAAACACLLGKLILTKYKIRQILAIGILCLLAFVAYRNSGRMGILLTVLALVGLKDMDIKKVFRLGLFLYGCAFAGTVALAWLGVIPNPMAVHEKGGVELIRWGMGYSTGNVFHISYFMLAVLLCYNWGKRYDGKKLAGLMAGNFLVFLYSLSYTGVLVTAFYLLLNAYAVKRKSLSRGERILCQLPLPCCLLFSFGVPFLQEYPWVQKLNEWMQARIAFSAYFLQNQPITLFGARMKNIPNFWIIMDNGYVYILMTYGIVAFLLFCAGYGILIARYSGAAIPPAGKEGSLKKIKGGRESGEGKLPELAIIFSFLLYGIMEQFISNAFMNFSLLFMGELLFGQEGEGLWGSGEGELPGGGEKAPGEGRGRQKPADKAGPEARAMERTKTAGVQVLLWLVCIGTGAAAAGIYLAVVPAKEYVEVGLDTVPYVDAVSALVETGNEQNTKEGLKERLESCRDALWEKEALERAIAGAGMEEKISAKELAAALEFSIPVSVQSSGTFDTFRVRILRLYWDISEEEYAGLLEQLLQQLAGKETGVYRRKDGIYGERIGRSFGEDRIEHISQKEQYRIEKSGSIVTLEHYRDGIFWGIAAAALLRMLMVITKAGERVNCGG